MRIYEVRRADADGCESEYYDNQREAKAALRLHDGLAELWTHDVQPTRRDIVRLLRHLAPEG